MAKINELVNICLKQFNIKNVEDFKNIQNFDDLKSIFANFDVSFESLVLNHEDILNDTIFFISKFNEDYLDFYLILKEKNNYFIIDESGFKEKIDFNNLKQNFINEILIIRKSILKTIKSNDILKSKNWKLIFLISIIYLLINFVSIVNGLFMSLVTRYVIEQKSLSNFWWLLITFVFIYILKILLSLIINYIVKYFIHKYFFKWHTNVWRIIIDKQKDFFNPNINLFLVNEYILELITFSICNIASLIVNIVTIVFSSILLLLINYWYFIICIFISIISVLIMFFKRKHQKEIYEENLIFQNHEKNIINNLYILKNSYFDTNYFNTNFNHFKQLINGNYLFNLKKAIKTENIDLINSIIIHVLNTIMLVIMIVNNINNFEIISNYFFIMSINNTFVSNAQNIFKLWIFLPEIKQKNKFINEIIQEQIKHNNGIKINEIKSLTLINPCFKNVVLNTKLKINQSTCLIGPSGIGKSYFLWSLCNFNCQNYELFINDINVQNIELKTLKNNIIYLKNDTPIISSKFDCLLNNQIYINLIGMFLEKNQLSIYDIRNNNLSNGQRQMINILNLLLDENKLILLDEVASNIDHQNLIFFNEYIFPIIKQKNLVIAVSHNPQIIKEYEQKINLYEFIQENNNC